MEWLKTILASSEKTVLPIGLVSLLLGLAVQWTTISTQLSAHEKDLNEMHQKQDEYNRIVQDIAVKLARIEGFLKRGGR